jgi:hypothetical protein
VVGRGYGHRIRQDQIHAAHVVCHHAQLFRPHLELGIIRRGKYLLDQSPLPHFPAKVCGEIAQILQAQGDFRSRLQGRPQPGSPIFPKWLPDIGIVNLGGKGVEFFGLAPIRQLRIEAIDVAPGARPRRIAPRCYDAFEESPLFFRAEAEESEVPKTFV